MSGRAGKSASTPGITRFLSTGNTLSKGGGAWGEIHPTYKAYARSMSFHVDACGPRHPEAKGKTEAKVKLCRRLLYDLARLRFGSLAELHPARASPETWLDFEAESA